MNPQDVETMKNVAYQMSMVACAMAEIEGMKAENMQREATGSSMAYPEKSFTDVIERYGIHHNAVVSQLNPR